MSRCCPTADSACRRTGSEGRGPPPSAAHPAAIAPEVTRTTACPSARSSAASPQSLSTAPSSRWPPASVTEDEPTFTTMVPDVTTAAPPAPGALWRQAPVPSCRPSCGPSPVGGLGLGTGLRLSATTFRGAATARAIGILVLRCTEGGIAAVVGEAHIADMDRVAVSCPGAPKGAFDTDPTQALLHQGEGVVVGQVRQGDGAQGGAATDHERPVVGSRHLERHLAHGPMDHRRAELGLELPACLVDDHGEPADQLVDAVAGEGGDARALPAGARGTGHVGPGPHDQPRPFEQLAAVAPELVLEHRFLFARGAVLG